MTPRNPTVSSRHAWGAAGLAGAVGASALLLAACDGSGRQVRDCSLEADQSADIGWEAYRAGELDTANESFTVAIDCDQDHPAALAGLGYVALRGNRLAEARRLFASVVERHPDDIDGLAGLGLVAWRARERDAATEAFRHVLRLDPEHAEALGFLQQLDPEFPAVVTRPALVKPDTVIYAARTEGDGFEVRDGRGWKPFYIKGVNLGAALPGRHPSQFPDSATYAEWIGEIAEMGANTIRLYTIHPPHFYAALLDHNLRHPASPLRLLHGVWAELPPAGNYLDAEWEADFFEEMRRVVDLLHGRADLTRRPGHASGSYTADISDWTLGYIIGREWEPFSVQAFNSRHPALKTFEGRYLRVVDGTPMDVWLARACEEMVAYEMEVFGSQRPIAYTNWPTLDPLDHPTETSVDEEVRLREALGETVERRPREYDNDAVSLDATRVFATAALPAGYFAAYHAYPYYPDFMALEPAYELARSPWGRSNYFAYLSALKAKHWRIPVVVAEYGVPASLGAAHLQPQGWHHGGHDEAAMAEIDARLTREIEASGMAGGAVFAWIDEWFKKNWLVIDFEIPLDRNRLWLNRLDAEQQYGMMALEPARALPSGSLSERLSEWRGLRPLYRAADGTTLRATADEAHLWLLFQPGDGAGAEGIEELLIGFDTMEAAAGDFVWPGGIAPRSPVGLEFVLQVTRDEARLLVDPPSNPFRTVAVRDRLDASRLSVPRIDDPLPEGFFSGRLEQCYRRPLRTIANEDGRYDSLRVITNRPRFGRDGQEFAALGYDRGVLRRGPLPDGNWEIDAATGSVEVRIPWGLLNVTDPSQRRILQDESGAPTLDCQSREGAAADFGTRTVEGFRLVAAARDARDSWSPLPGSGKKGDVALFTWPTWEEPIWRSRRRPVFEAMRSVFETLDQPAHRQEMVSR